ncbi:MAG: hypothetical protein IKG83_03405 [Prevotella sp.]|nr:hypothetical protein [Prevotella sp.]
MIDFDYESEIFTDIYNAVIADYPDAYIGTDIDRTPPSFPVVNVLFSDSNVTRRFVNSSRKEKYRDIRVTVEVYSNLQNGRQAQAAGVMAIVDNLMRTIGLVGYQMNPVNLTSSDNEAIYRLLSRYEGTVDDKGVFYTRR